MNTVINYISTLSADEKRGGWDGSNAAVFARMRQQFTLNYVGPIDPPTDIVAKTLSKAKRLFGLQGGFQFYSQRRLQHYAEQVKARSASNASGSYFHGSTPWVLYDPPHPYYAYLDACFLTYLHHYHAPSLFSPRDIRRICEAEASWLAKAKHVFFTSAWALEETRHLYQIPGQNFRVVGIGGSIEVPPEDRYQGGTQLLAVVTDFERKGGRLSYEAFRKVQELFPASSLVYVGQKPPPEILGAPGVRYEGYLSKSNPEQRARLCELFAQAFVHLLPSSGDMTPNVVAELGYFGCPSIAPARFGIPEMILHDETGILLSGPISADALANAVVRMCNDREFYIKMRKRVREYCVETFSWETVVQKMVEAIGH